MHVHTHVHIRTHKHTLTQDQDRDTKVSLEDFQTTVMKERLLIEAFGPCLPTSKSVDQFSRAIFAQD